MKGKIVSNEIVGEKNIYERLWKLETKVRMMVMDGTRDPKKVADLLQNIVNIKVYLKFAYEVITFGDRVVGYDLVKEATFLQMFGDLGEKRRCWENQEKAIAFSAQNMEKLGPDGNFFELEGGLVARVDDYGRPRPKLFGMYHLSYRISWSARCQHRVVSLQQ